MHVSDLGSGNRKPRCLASPGSSPHGYVHDRGENERRDARPQVPTGLSNSPTGSDELPQTTLTIGPSFDLPSLAASGPRLQPPQSTPPDEGSMGIAWSVDLLNHPATLHHGH